MGFSLGSSAFSANGEIPSTYASDSEGQNVPPPLHWDASPDGTKSFALIMEDLDAPLIGRITHWIVFNIPREVTAIDDEKLKAPPLAGQVTVGRNIFNRNEYLGPNPPFGVHRYRFTIYALDQTLDGGEKTTGRRLNKLIAGKVLAKAELTGTYMRKK